MGWDGMDGEEEKKESFYDREYGGTDLRLYYFLVK
jgi:hypothetical protein